MTRIPKPKLGELMFRWRSYLPLAVVIGLMVGLHTFGPTAELDLRWCVLAGLLVAASGLALRLYAVGQAPRGTSGRHRRQYASQLNTFGIYSVLRHPLYVGNVLVWVGVSLTSGWLAGALASTVAAVLMFGLIVRHEDEYLLQRFGPDFVEWASVTPAFVPRPSLWRPSRLPFRWARAVSSEYSTFHSIGLMALIFAALRGWSLNGEALPGPTWWGLLALNSGLYLGTRLWRSGRKDQEGPTTAC